MSTSKEFTEIRLGNQQYEELMGLLKKSDDILKSEQPYSELELKSILTDIFGILDSQGEKLRSGESIENSVGEVKRYIDDNYASINSISEIAERFYYSREHLSRKFMNAFGISIANYLARRRVMESLSLLDHMSVADVAYAVGYRSQSAFISVFKKYMRCLPSEYKTKSK